MAAALQRQLLHACRLYTRLCPLERGKQRLHDFALRHFNPHAPLEFRLAPGIRIELDITDLLQSILFFRGVYERESMELWQEVIEPGDTVIDVGANIGLYTLLAAANVGKAGAVHAFEPAPQLFIRLLQNAQRNGLRNVRAHNIAVSDRCGAEKLYLAENSNRGKNSLCRDNAAAPDSAAQSICVASTALDDYLQRKGIRAIKAMKVDVEGAELRVFEGAQSVLARDDAPFLFFEASDLLSAGFGYTSIELKAHLRRLGYTVWRMRKRRLFPVADDESHRLEDLVALKPAHFARTAVRQRIRESNDVMPRRSDAATGSRD